MKNYFWTYDIKTIQFQWYLLHTVYKYLYDYMELTEFHRQRVVKKSRIQERYRICVLIDTSIF